MPFSNLAGNLLAKRMLCSYLDKNQLPSTLLFHGESGSQKKRFALALAKSLIKQTSEAQHPDIHLYEPEGKGALHPVEKIRDLIQEAVLPPYQASAKVFIIIDADHMYPASSNTLLKTLEEPLPNTYFILITNTLEAILPTIVSRSHKIPFFPIDKNVVYNWQEPLWKMLSLPLPEGYFELPSLATEVEQACDVGEEESILPQADAIFEEILHWYRDLHLLKVGANPELLYHRLNQLSGAAQNPLPTLETLLEKVENSRLALQRHIKLHRVLETFFLIS